MPAPTITAVTPSAGEAGGGFLVVITGTGFDVAVGPNPAPTVSVLFDTLAARDVRVTSATRLTCLPPRGEIPDDKKTLDVDITVTNEDQSIPNSVTGVDAFTYRRPDLSKSNPSHLLTVVNTLIERMRQQIIANVVLTTHTDFDLSTADLFNRVQLAKLPAIIIVGPTVSPQRIVPFGERTLVTLPAGSAQPTDFERYDNARAVDLEWDVRLLSKSKKQILNLIQAAVGFTQRNEYLEDIPRDPLTPGSGVVRYPLRIVEEFSAIDSPSRANVREAVGSWLIEGVLLETGDLVEAAPTVDTTVVTTEQIP